MIDRVPVLEKFSEMLYGTGKERVLRIIGTENMGKSRLLREFRLLSNKKEGVCCALVDLRSKYQDYSDIVFQITQQMHFIEYRHFSEVQQQLLSRQNVNIKGLKTLLSTVSINAQEQRSEDYDRQIITSSFCKDLRLAKFEYPAVLLFDTFDIASPKIQDWVIEQLLSALLQIPNIYVVIAGRSLPPPHAIWDDKCASFELLPVSLEDNIAYCNSLGINASIEIIKAFHDAFDGSPGLFSIYAPKLNKEK